MSGMVKDQHSFREKHLLAYKTMEKANIGALWS
jgi:hypothetical protein